MQYGVIVADPPWRFHKWTPNQVGSRSINNHYSTMALEDIKALPVQDYAAKDCALFLWTIDTCLDKAFEVITAWGFEYRTVAFCWAKLTKRSGAFHMGCGWWTRANQEICLLAVRGRPRPLARDVRRLVVSPRREHSRKPDRIYETDIPRLVAGPYLELFARCERAGWDTAFSDQVEKFNP